MKIKFIIMTVFVFCMMFAMALPAMAADYVGSETCSKCHMDKYNDWKVSGHPYKLSKAADAMNRGAPVLMPVPAGSGQWPAVDLRLRTCLPKSCCQDRTL